MIIAFYKSICYTFFSRSFLFYLIQYMNSYSSLQKKIASLMTLVFLSFISPVSIVNATTLTGTLEITATGNIVTPSYGFDSDATGTIAYG